MLKLVTKCTLKGVNSQSVSKQTNTKKKIGTCLLTHIAAKQTSCKCPEQNAPLPQMPTQS